MWLSRKLSLLLKQKSPLHSSSSFIHSFGKKKEQHVSFVLTITSGVNSTGKSTFINCLGLEELDQHRNLYRLKSNEQFIIQILEYNGIPPSMEKLDGALICYDITNRDSVDYLPDMINAFVSQHVPCLLIGLKSDLTVLRTVDPQLGQLIGNLFGVQAIESDSFTFQGVQIFQKCFYQFIYSDRKVLLLNQQQGMDLHPVTAAVANTASYHHVPASIKLISTSTQSSTTEVDIISRSSSSCSTATSSGESVYTIVDNVLNDQYDANVVIIFQTVFRKFMKPLDLVNILVERFESDLTQESDTVLPTVRQNRIRSFFCLWLSQYWGDFKSSATRRMMIQFLERVASYDSLSSISDVLLPLAIRDPATCDKDMCWGMRDDEDTDAKSSRKKDSGYNESFGDWIIGHNHVNHEIQPKKRPTLTSLTPIRRAVSTTNSHAKVPVSFKSLVALATTADRRSSIPFTYHYNEKKHTSSAVFAGGLVSTMEQKRFSVVVVDPYQVLHSLTPFELAEQLTYVEAEIFRKIQPRDFLRHLWSQRKKSRSFSSKNPVLASIEHFNFVSGWIASLIVKQALLDKRVTVFEFCLKTAVELRGLNNFNTLMAVLAGINSAAVLRLKLTRDKSISRNKKLYDKFLELESLMSSERSFSNYRSTLKQTELPGIPYLGIHQQDLVSLGEANKDHKTDGKVHWKKFRLMGESILEMVRFQYPTYLLEPNPFILYFIGHQSIPTEDERYEISKQIEPRTTKASLSTSSSTSSRWLSALK